MVSDAGKKRLAVVVLAKNEEQNIARCLDALKGYDWAVTVLDSGSEDATREIVSSYNFATLVAYAYKGHCDAYNEIIVDYFREYEYVVILDSDMVVSNELRKEVEGLLARPARAPRVLVAPVAMFVAGEAVGSGSLYPPKPFVFSTGQPLFRESGHGERLVDGVSVERTSSFLVHDDRKDYGSFLASQYRYANSLVDRYRAGQVSSRDRFRCRFPFMIGLVPFVSYVLKGGVFYGRAGLVYALDRLIAEAIMYRQAVADRMRRCRKGRP